MELSSPIMYVLYEVDSNKFLQYCDKLNKESDHMSAHRIEVLVKVNNMKNKIHHIKKIYAI